MEFKLQVMQKITILKIKSTNLIKLYFISQYTAFLNFISSLKKVKIDIADLQFGLARISRRTLIHFNYY